MFHGTLSLREAFVWERKEYNLAAVCNYQMEIVPCDKSFQNAGRNIVNMFPIPVIEINDHFLRKILDNSKVVIYVSWQKKRTR